MHNQESNLIVQWPLVDPTWTNDDHSMFENAMATGSNGFKEMAGMIRGMVDERLKVYHEALVRELLETKAGRVKLPDYPDGDSYPRKVRKEAKSVANSGSGSKPQEKKRRANPWTVDEHIRFLEGLKKYGKGDWRSISRMAVVTRTATQVASHAQKFFLRQAAQKEQGINNNKKKKRKKRRSIHDITTADVAVVVTPTTSSPSEVSGGQLYGSQERGAESSVTLRPSIQNIATTDTTMVVHAHQTPPADSLYDHGKDKGVLAEVTTSSAPYFGDGQYFGGQGEGVQPPMDYIYGDQVGEAPPPLFSFYDSQLGGEPHPLFSFYEDEGGELLGYDYSCDDSYYFSEYY